MNEASLIQILVQSGAVGTNILLIYVIYKVAMAFREDRKAEMERHDKEQTDENTSRVLLAEALTKLSDRIQDCPSRKTFKQA